MALPIKPNCPSTKVSGKLVSLDICWDVCGDITDPTKLVFVPLGGMQTKGMSRSQEFENTTDDRTVGDYQENTPTTKSMSFSGSGFMNYTDGEYSNLVALDHLFATEGAVFLHCRITEPHATTYAYMILTSYNRDWPTDTPVTYEIELQVTSSGYGVMVVPTTPYVEPTSVTVDPVTLTMAVNDVEGLATEVLPAGAPQNVTFESDDAAIASVTPVGVVTAHAVGTATITVKVAGKPSLTATCAVTVS